MSSITKRLREETTALNVNVHASPRKTRRYTKMSSGLVPGAENDDAATTMDVDPPNPPYDSDSDEYEDPTEAAMNQQLAKDTENAQNRIKDLEINRDIFAGWPFAIFNFGNERSSSASFMMKADTLRSLVKRKSMPSLVNDVTLQRIIFRTISSTAV